MSATKEQIHMEFQVHLEEYRAKMQSINEETNALHQTFALTITGIGAILAATHFIVQLQIGYVFAFTSFVFYGLALTQLRHIWTILAVEAYIAETLKPNIQEMLYAISPQSGRQFNKILLWSSFQSRSAYVNRWVQFPIESARYLLPILAGVSCCIAYWVIPTQRSVYIDNGIIVFNAIVVLYILVCGVVIRTQFVRDRKEKKKSFYDHH